MNGAFRPLQTNFTKAIPFVPLLVTSVHYKHHTLNVLFDNGSHTNVIGKHLLERLSLTSETLPRGWSLSMANQSVQHVSQAVRQLHLTFDAFDADKNQVPLHFLVDFLVMEANFDLLLGISFSTHHQLAIHYCQTTLIYTSNTNHRVTIPLHSSCLDAPCTHTACPYATPLPFPTPSPQFPPFIPPTPYKHFAPSPPPLQLATITDSSSSTSDPPLACMNLFFNAPIDPLLTLLMHDDIPLLTDVSCDRAIRSPDYSLFMCLVRSTSNITTKTLIPYSRLSH